MMVLRFDVSPGAPSTSPPGHFETRGHAAQGCCAGLLRPWQQTRGPSAGHSSRHYLRDGYTCFRWFAAASRLWARSARFRAVDLCQRGRRNDDEDDAGAHIRTLEFRIVLVGDAVISAAFLFGYSLFRPDTPHLVIFVALLAGGFFRSLQMTSINTLCYADVP